MDLAVSLQVIGIVHTAHTEFTTTPIQAGLNRAEHGTIEIADRYRDGLYGLADFDYAWLLTWLDKLADPGTEPPLRQVPFLLRAQQRELGVFANRGPRHVNPIGLSLVQLLDVREQVIRFAGVDLLDGTPVIDLKPYVARFDRPPSEPRCGWYDHVQMTDGVTPGRLAPPANPPA